MQLDEPLGNCLQSLASRYPHCLVEVNKAILGPKCAPHREWTCHELIVYAQQRIPEVFDAQARLIRTGGESSIYLLDRSVGIAAFWIYLPKNRHPWLEEEQVAPLVR